MQPVEPIMIIDLFPQERKQLLELFSDLEAEDWERPTICPGWTVKDIGLHLLGDDIGYLSGGRGLMTTLGACYLLAVLSLREVSSLASR